jgi:hypothetical protein
MNALRTSRLMLALVAVALGLFSASVYAQDKKVDVTGKWKWTQAGRDGGQGRDIVLTLKQEGDKVTGSMPGRQGGDPIAITDGKVVGDMLTFSVVRETQNGKFTTKYSGKVDGETIKGKIAMDRGGQTTERDWEAKKEKAA